MEDFDEVLAPQEGSQEDFINSDVDITIFGGRQTCLYIQ